jgi:hypothetical protein
LLSLLTSRAELALSGDAPSPRRSALGEMSDHPDILTNTVPLVKIVSAVALSMRKPLVSSLLHKDILSSLICRNISSINKAITEIDLPQEFLWSIDSL